MSIWNWLKVRGLWQLPNQKDKEKLKFGFLYMWLRANQTKGNSLIILKLAALFEMEGKAMAN